LKKVIVKLSLISTCQLLEKKLLFILVKPPQCFFWTNSNTRTSHFLLMVLLGFGCHRTASFCAE